MFDQRFPLGALAVVVLLAHIGQGQTKTVLYTFTGSTDGGQPQSRLVLDSAGNLYGTTFSGGLACPVSSLGCGTVFELSPNGAAGWNETVIHTFIGGTDGAYPTYAGLAIDSSGNLYGTTSRGGTGCSTSPSGCGVVFELSPSAKSWTEKILYNFCSELNCTDGQFPGGALMRDISGNLYGSTWQGVFELSPSPNGAWQEQIIYPLSMVDPNAGLIMDASGNIFGIGSSSSVGLPVFELSPNGSGGWNGQVLYTFPSVQNYYSVGGTPTFDKTGNIFGNIDNLVNDDGYVYKLTLEKSGKWRVSFLPHYAEFYHQGSLGGVLLDQAGNVYGTASTFVYELLVSDDYQLEKLGSIDIGNDLVVGRAGDFFGTDTYGGSYRSGTVFEVIP